ncbi:low molecular weight phosphotyrosine protein phosphatase [Lentimicrobium sp. L6]|nr:low molecular weight phosphotyrosine protein phosphatase [Lentimicrobium sp. S6]NPD86874.1 low molecular weight phosphotyrosine protein phosphatase [Lentimicrobium sp. L6]
MVCLGNICRSPMAEGIMRDKISEYDIEAQVDSCGTANYHVGESPDHRAQKTLKQHQSDISMLRGRQFQVNDFDKFDLIFTMDESNYTNIKALARNEQDEEKVEMIMNMAYPNENIPVPDPYYGGINGFEEVYQMLTLACDQIAIGIKN